MLKNTFGLFRLSKCIIFDVFFILQLLSVSSCGMQKNHTWLLNINELSGLFPRISLSKVPVGLLTFLLPKPWKNNWIHSGWFILKFGCFFTKWIGKNELACSSSQTRFLTSLITNQNDILEVTGYRQPFCLCFQQAEQFLLLTFLVESRATRLHLTHQMSLSFGFMISYLQLRSLQFICVLLNSSNLSSHVVDWSFCAVRSFTCVSWIMEINNKTLPHLLSYVNRTGMYAVFFRTVCSTWDSQKCFFYNLKNEIGHA
jgi:hypothetical protein